ncbi:MAG: T9SS type A sorting domain-containing protein [Bacteroidetes bacterium]|nr:T9SS type A sorting domain-containing protein [Bacteroidota bacterium]
MEDLDGRSKLSNIVLIKGNKPTQLAISGIFPNPVSTEVNVLVDAPLREKVTLMIINASGKTVLQKVITIEAGSNTIPVNTSTLANGSYLVKLICNSNCESAVSKFVKQ